MSKFNVVVIGGNHHNALGVIRSLGERGIYANVIITNDNKYAYIVKSKYVKQYDIVKEDEESIKKILLEKYSKINPKCLLIPTSDFAALFIDKNLTELQKYFLVPNIDNKQNEIKKYMDKYEQFKLTKDNKITMAQTFEIDLSNKLNIDKYSLPCIIKPETSALGNKKDIKICHNRKELTNAIEDLKRLKYQKVILQEYIDYDYECGVIGCCNNSEIIIPGIIKKIRIYPLKRGSNSYSKIIDKDKLEVDIKPITNLLKSLNYQGLFDIEIFVKDNKLYLNEINFRNSGNSYAYNYGKVNLAYLWVLLMNNKSINEENKTISKEYYFVDEILEIKQLIDKNISFKEYLKTFSQAKSYFLLNSNDIMVILFWKNIYAILKRIDKKIKI